MSKEMPSPEQKRYPVEGQPDVGETNHCPRTTKYDLRPEYSRTRVGTWGDEQTFCVVEKGNEE